MCYNRSDQLPALITVTHFREMFAFLGKDFCTRRTLQHWKLCVFWCSKTVAFTSLWYCVCVVVFIELYRVRPFTRPAFEHKMCVVCSSCQCVLKPEAFDLLIVYVRDSSVRWQWGNSKRWVTVVCVYCQETCIIFHVHVSIRHVFFPSLSA